MNTDFERYLRDTNLSENTISSYLFAVRQFHEQYEDITQKKSESIQGVADREL